MTYTPINWQTGDTITAEKMNKMDNGWGVESTQLFSETVTTVAQNGMYSGPLDYSGTINADSITVTFDGTEYTCPRIYAFGEYFYGGFTEQGPAFTEYPFAIESNGSTNKVYTETAGTYVVAASAQDVEFSADFSEAIKAAVDLSTLPFRCVPNVTAYAEMRAAADAGRLIYFYTYEGDGFHLVLGFTANASATAVSTYPEGVANVETFGFEDVDGTLVFRVFTY